MATVEGGSWPSKNNRQGRSEGAEPSELPGPSLRPVAVRENANLRDEARAARVGPGEIVPLDRVDPDELMDRPEIQARPTHRVLNEWERWMRDYQNSHIEFDSPDGDRVRAPLENSYQESYSRRYYARIKDLERAVRREFDGLTTVMLTFTASHRNANGEWRCPADHLRDVVDGWGTARKQLYHVLDGYRWEYARILEPHQNGYGHVHVAVFVEADDLDAERFRPVMRSHVENCRPAGTEAHTVENAVSVNDSVENVGSYLSEYLGIYGENQTALDRPDHERLFYAITWATNTRRLDFSNGAQEMISREEFRRETGLRPSDRGDAKASQTDAEREEGAGGGWTVERLCEASESGPHYYDPTTGGVQMGPIDGRPGFDPPPDRN